MPEPGECRRHDRESREKDRPVRRRTSHAHDACASLSVGLVPRRRARGRRRPARSLAYYPLVTAVPVVAVAALSALGDVLDGSAAEPHDRGIAMLSALALPFVLLGTAVRAPLLAEGPPPAIGVTAVIMALAIFADPGARQGERRGAELPRRLRAK